MEIVPILPVALSQLISKFYLLPEGGELEIPPTLSALIIGVLQTTVKIDTDT